MNNQRLKQFMTDNHKRAVRSLAYLLHDGDYDGWCDASIIWRARLTPVERAQLAYSALRSLDTDQAARVAATVLSRPGMPLPPFLDVVGEAADWAAWADPEQINATAVACFNAMPPAEQSAFAGHIGRRAA